MILTIYRSCWWNQCNITHLTWFHNLWSSILKSSFLYLLQILSWQIQSFRVALNEFSRTQCSILNRKKFQKVCQVTLWWLLGSCESTFLSFPNLIPKFIIKVLRKRISLTKSQQIMKSRGICDLLYPVSPTTTKIDQNHSNSRILVQV